MRNATAFLRRLDPVWWFALAFFGMCCAYEAGRVLHLRPQPMHLWRQSDCIALAWNYYDTTWNLFEPATHLQMADDLRSGRSAGEFPLLYWIVGMIWRITGPSEFLFRLIVLLLHAAGSFALFASVRRITGSAFWAGCTGLLLFTSPVVVYYGIAFLPDMPAFDLVLIGWWQLTRYAADRRRRTLGWAVFFFTLAMLTKMTAGMGFLALLIVLLRESLPGKADRWRLFAHRGFAWAAFCIGLLAVYGWYAYAAAYNHRHGFKYTFNDIWPIWEMTREGIDGAWNIATGIIVFQVFDTSVWVMLGAALVALVANARRIPRPLWLLLCALFVGVVLYVILWFHALDGHDYYFINPLIVPLSVLTAFLWWLGRDHPDILGARWTRWAAVALLLYNTAYAAQNMRMRYDETGRMSYANLWPLYHERELKWWNDLDWWGMGDLVKGEAYLRSIGVKKEDKVLFLDDGSLNGALVLLGQRGWTAFGTNVNDPDAIDTLRARGLRYIIFTRSEWLNDRHLRPWLDTLAGQSGNMRIFVVKGLPGEHAAESDQR